MAGLDRDEILRRFEAWLDEALAREEPPRGIDAELLNSVAGVSSPAGTEEGGAADSAASATLDAYTLWSAMTALTHEVKLQGRAFKELSATTTEQAARVGDELRAAYHERERELQREAERRSQQRLLDGLFELHDKLDRGLQSTEAAGERLAAARRRPWWDRMLRRSVDSEAALTAIAAVTRGYELGLEHLARMLAGVNVRPIRCEGQPFDPRRMNAIDKAESSAMPEGTVLEVYRKGYEWNGDVHRLAQVKVSVTPKGE